MSASPYAPPAPRGPVDLRLSANEGRAPRGLDAVAPTPAELARYPDLAPLRRALAAQYGVGPERVLVTAGGDDALLRACLATLAPGRSALVAAPTFEMIPRYVAVAGGALRTVDWPEGPFPTDALLAAADGSVAVAFVVSPNNPTGGVATLADVERVARALPDALVVLDAAYGELADDDPTAAALALPNVVVVRTLSKAWGLAGLRVGAAVGNEDWLARLAAAGNPYPVSAASAAIALERLRTGGEDMADYAARVRLERDALCRRLERIGARPARPAQANFVLARGLDPAWTCDAAAALGVGLRRFPDAPSLADAVRITVPGDAAAFERLERTLDAVLAPDALLFDLDGVLADVSTSYRAAIAATAADYGVAVDDAAIAAAKARGGANDDWALTRDLLRERGVDAPLAEVTARFEERYQGSGGAPGLRETERPCVSRERLASWAARRPLGVVTGRPRADALRFLERFDLLPLFRAVVCREDAPLKPDPAPVRLALERLGARSAWLLGDTRDDLDAARGAGVVPIGVVPPGADAARARRDLLDAGAARALPDTDALEALLP